MAERTTPADLARWLHLSQWVHNGELTYEQIMEVRSAADMDEAMALVAEFGFAPIPGGMGGSKWEQFEQDARVARANKSQQDQVLLNRMPEGYIPPEVLAANPGLAEADRLRREAEAERNLYQEEVEKWQAAQQGEPELSYSQTLFPESGIDARHHIEATLSDDYSPWSRPRHEVASESMRFISMEPGLTPEQQVWYENQYQQNAYFSGQEVLEWGRMSEERKANFERQWLRAGLLTEADDGTPNYTPGAMGTAQLNAMRETMKVGNYIGFGISYAADLMAREGDQARSYADALGGSTGRARASFSIPASLRQIPDYESITQEVHNLFRQRLGRDAEEWELGVLADEMQTQYRTSNAEKIKAARAAFAQAQGGGSGVLEIEVPDPVLRQQKFIEERYADEIGRQDQIADTAATNRLMIDAITRGARMVEG